MGGCNQSITICLSFLILFFPASSWDLPMNQSFRSQSGLPIDCSSFLNTQLLHCGILQRLLSGDMVLLQLQMDNLIHHSLFHGLQGNLCSSPWCTSCIPSLMGSSFIVCRAVSHNCCHYSLLPVQHFTLLKYIFPRHLKLCYWAKLCPALGFLELSVSSTSQPLAFSHKGHPCSLHATSTLHPTPCI